MPSRSPATKPAPTKAAETYLYQPVPANDDSIRIGWMYPADYTIAMSSLGYLMLYRQLDSQPGIAATRVTTDTLQHHRANEFELMGFSFSFELDMMAILQTLETLDLPIYAKDRDRHAPLVFAGGPVVMTNPEPYAAFFDFFLIGEGEELLMDLEVAYRRHRHLASREELLHALAIEVPGLYVPSLYEVTYEGPEGPIAAITPRYDDIPFPVKKRFIENMDNFVASSPILTENTIFSNTFLVEVMRGCAHRCRFCLASYSMLPTRGASLEPIIEAIESGLVHTKKIGLLGALIADHPQFDQLCDYLNTRMDQLGGLTLSSSSLRADTLTLPIAQTFKKGNQNQLTIAVESGSERLRRRINKNLKHDQILQAAAVMSEAGMKGMKVYGMVGLPEEEESDVEELGALMKELRKLNPRLELHLGCSSFVPKAGTPFQWMPRLENKNIDRRFEILRKQLLKVANFRPSSTKWDFFQAFLSRGDRRLAPLLVRFYQLGSSLGTMHRAYKELKQEGLVDFPPLEWYALRERPETEVLPWDALHLGVSKEILYKEGLPPPGFPSRQPTGSVVTPSAVVLAR
jgi:radical SAM superfamily enzyme YgiQ (UPF0313 family)